MKLYFIRHGKTQGNIEQRYVGRTDEPLSEEGRKELQERKKRGEYPPDPLTVYVSPLRRCRESASIIFPNAVQVPIEEFIECDFGDFEMKRFDELDGDPEYQKWIDGGGIDPFPNGESMGQLQARAMKGFYRVMERTGGADLYFVVHGGTIMAVLSQIEGGNFYSYTTKNGECVVYEVSTGD